MIERYIKRTIWVAKCPQCGEQKEHTSKPARERFCMTCKAWVPYVEESYVGPEIGA